MPYTRTLNTIIWQPWIGRCEGQGCWGDCYLQRSKAAHICATHPLDVVQPLTYPLEILQGLILAIRHFDVKQLIVSYEPACDMNHILSTLIDVDLGHIIDITVRSRKMLFLSETIYSKIRSIAYSIPPSKPLHPKPIHQLYTMLPIRTMQSGIHSIYYILKKPPLGGSFPNLSDVLFFYQTGLRESINTLSDLQDIQIIPDTCYKAHQSYRQNKTTCNAGIHQVHIWPDGSVTGCPYDSNLLHAFRRASLIDSIEACLASKSHPFLTSCGLGPEIQVRDTSLASIFQRIASREKWS